MVGNNASALNADGESRERDELFRLLELHDKNRLWYGERIWENAKFFHGAYAVLILGASAFFAKVGTDLLAKWPYKAFLLILIFLAGLSAYTGFKNLLRETRLVFLHEGTEVKLVRALKLHRLQDQVDPPLPNEEHILPEKWRELILPDFPSPLLKFLSRSPERVNTLREWVRARTRMASATLVFGNVFILEMILLVPLIVAVILVR